MNNSFRAFIFSICLTSVFSCQQQVQYSSKTIAKENAAQEIASEITPARGASQDTIVYDTLIFPRTLKHEFKILTTGSFHRNEVDPGSDQTEWFGIFKSDTTVYIASTKIKVENVYDAIVDDEGEKTGLKVSTENTDRNILLIEKTPSFKEMKLVTIAVPEYVYPGDTLRFFFKGVDYFLTATGGKRKLFENSDSYEVWNYQLYLAANINGEQQESLLVAAPRFDDAITNILFAGDIDDDGLLDLIIDTSRHYNAASPTLYLSTEAEGIEIVKPVARHTAVGC